MTADEDRMMGDYDEYLMTEEQLKKLCIEDIIKIRSKTQDFIEGEFNTGWNDLSHEGKTYACTLKIEIFERPEGYKSKQTFADKKRAH